jgi:hypothetical protein
MTKTITKPKSEEVTTMSLPDVGLRFNSQRVGPTTFKGLRENDYGEGFRMPTIPELVPLVYASLENKNHDIAKDVIETLKNHWLTGNTGILHVSKKMFVQDNTEIKDGRIFMNQKALESKLSSHEEKGVVFSDDKSIRFIHYGFKKELQSALDLSRNTGIIALVGGEENAEKLAKASGHYKASPYFWVLENVDFPIIRVADLYSHHLNDQLIIRANNDESFTYNYSFGTQKIKQEGEAQ